MRTKWMIGLVAFLFITAGFSKMTTQAYAAVETEELWVIEESMFTSEDEAFSEEFGTEKFGQEANDFVTMGIEDDHLEVEEESSNQNEIPDNEVLPDIEELPDVEEINPFEQDAKQWEKAQLNTTYIRTAKMTTYQLRLKKVPLQTSEATILWKTSNNKIATVDNKGNITAIKAGTAIITCEVKTGSGYQKQFICEVEVTNPKFTKSTYVVAKGTKLELEIKGTTTEKYTISGSNEELLKVYKKQLGLVRGKRVGTVIVKAIVDRKEIQCEVVISNPKMKKDLFVLTKASTDWLQVYNNSGKTKITYKSSNEKVATVSSKGKITTYGLGVAVITVTVDNKQFEITVSVGTTQAVAAIRNAQKALGCTYSQMYRMRPGYYDCSSLVWRCYVPTGITFGYSKYATNAPTAAGEAYYLVSKNRELAKTYVDESKLLPGDLIFMATGYNGRFRNISHVAIYIGNDIIIHATPRNTNDVQYGTYSYYKNMTVSIGRPS